MFDYELSAVAQVGVMAGGLVLAWFVVLWIFWHRPDADGRRSAPAALPRGSR